LAAAERCILINDQGRIIHNCEIKAKQWTKWLGDPAKVYNTNGVECLQVLYQMVPFADVRAALMPVEHYLFGGPTCYPQAIREAGDAGRYSEQETRRADEMHEREAQEKLTFFNTRHHLSLAVMTGR
jgi:hypothetical protein